MLFRSVAVIRAEPGANPVATPASLTRRTVLSEEDHAIGADQGSSRSSIEANIRTGKPEGSGESGACRTMSREPTAVSVSSIGGRRSASGSVHTRTLPCTSSVPSMGRVPASSATVVRSGAVAAAGSGPASGRVPVGLVAQLANRADAVIRRTALYRSAGRPGFTIRSRDPRCLAPRDHPRTGLPEPDSR